MSPDITPAVRPFLIRSGGAARILTDSLNAAHGTGVTVTTGTDLGVVCTSTADPRWEIDPRASAVSLLGCVLLIKQPPIADAEKALSHVFDTRREFINGIELGVTGEAAPEVADELLAEGYFLGVQMRTLVATVPCTLHLTRFPRGGMCPQCAGAVPVERSTTETTRPLDTPRSLIAGLLASLTPAQVLERVADDFRARRVGPLTPREATELDMAEQMLRELAVDFELRDGEEG